MSSTQKMLDALKKSEWANRRHRGAADDMRLFASRFLQDRLLGFEKDMHICLTGYQLPGRAEPTHAYFPALMSCCGTLEYFVSLYLGRKKPCGVPEFVRYTRAFMEPLGYTEELVRVLVEAFRHSIAHHGVATGLWIDERERDPAKRRRITWRVRADSHRPALEIVEERKSIVRHPPWPCPITHRAHIRLGRLWRDIVDSVLRPGSGYRDTLLADARLMVNFRQRMEHLYPRP